MAADAWDRLVAAVEAASDLPAAEADAALVASLGDDADLLQEARTILAAGQADDAFLMQPPPTADEALGTALRPSIEGYEIRDVIGRGGMGTVYRAEQRAPRREVALKVLSVPFADDAARQRFLYEIEALAALRHPGIAHIHAAGLCEDGVGRPVPWFAMELVPDATPLCTWARRQGLDLRARLRLLIDVCDAVQHGHQRGVVHRDLKPENVLVDEDGRTAVIDYGVARSIAAVGGARAGRGRVIGTLAYMSPERVRGEPGDVRADVYALGVILYELITDHVPLEVSSADLAEATRQIGEVLPDPPGQRRPGVEADLDAIALKALAKDPEERYASVDALGEDLRRYLAHQPVEARASGRGHHLRLFARRHRTLVLAAATVTAIALAAGVLTVNWAVRSDQAERLAVSERAVAEAERSRTQRLFETLLERNVQSTVEAAPKLLRSPNGAEHAKALLDRVLDDVEVLERIADNDPRVQGLLAEALLRLGDAQGNQNFLNLGQEEEALASYERALAIAVRLARGRPADAAIALVQARARVGIAQLLAQADRRARVRTGEVDPEVRARRRSTLEAVLAGLEPLSVAGDLRADRILVEAHALLGRVAIDDADFAAARAQADAIQRFYDEGRLPPDVLAHALRAWTAYYAKRYDEAVAAWDEVIALRMDWAASREASFDESIRLADALASRAEAAWFAGHFESSAETFERAEAVLASLAGVDAGTMDVIDRQILFAYQRMNMHKAQHDAALSEDERAAALQAAVDTARRVEAQLPPADGARGFATSLRVRIARMRTALEAQLQGTPPADEEEASPER